MAINTEMQKALFKGTNKFVIEKGSDAESENILMALSVNRMLQEYGYSLDAESLRTLSTQNAMEMSKTWKSMESIVADVTGASSFKGELFYPNFPEEVMSKSEAELYLNSMFYYTFSQNNNKTMNAIANELRHLMVEEKQERLPLLEKYPKELKLIHVGTENDLFTIMDNRIHALNMSESQFNELAVFSKEYPDKFNEFIHNDKKYQSKESLVKIAGLLYEEGRYAELKSMLKDSVDVLRFAGYLSEKRGLHQNYIELKRLDKSSAPINFSLTTSQKKLIKSMLNNCNGLYYDIWRKEGTFKNLMGRVSPSDPSTPKRVKQAFDNLAQNRKLDEKGRHIDAFSIKLSNAIDHLNDTGDVSQMQKLANKFPGEFLAVYNSTIAKVDQQYRSLAIPMIKECVNSSSIPLKRVLTTKAQLMIDFEAKKKFEQGNPIAKTYHPNRSPYSVINEGINLDEKSVEQMKNVLQETAEEMVKGYQRLGKVYIDPKMKDFKAPGHELRNASGGSTIVPYSTLEGNKEKNLLIFGCRWGVKKNNPNNIHLDIDLAAAFLDKDYNQIDHVYYHNLVTKGGYHSGDYTEVGKNGEATEAIILDKELLKERGVKYISAEVHCYSVQSFREVDNCRFVFEEKEGSVRSYEENRDKNHSVNVMNLEYEKGYPWTEGPFNRGKSENHNPVFLGEVFEPRQMENCIDIISDSSSTVPIIYDVEEDKIIWLDRPACLINRPSNVINPEVRFGVAGSIDYYNHNPIPTMYDVVETYAKHNGEITEDITQANTVFTANAQLDPEKENLMPNARIVSSWDLDTFSAEFSGNADLSKIQKDTPELIAYELTSLQEMFDHYDYQDNMDTHEKETKHLIEAIQNGNVNNIVDSINEQIEESDNKEFQDRAKDILARLDNLVRTCQPKEDKRTPALLKQLHYFHNQIDNSDRSIDIGFER